MRKIFYQWAGIGILASIGWGVDLVPSNTSWIPSGIIWGAAFVWLVGTLIYLSKNREQLQFGTSLLLTPHTYAIGLSGMTGYPKEPDDAEWLCLEVAVNAIDKPIDTLDLQIGDKTIPANYWPGKNVTAFNVYFNVTEWRWKGKNQIELIAHVGGELYSSGRNTIDFSLEPGVIGHRI